MAEFGWAYLSGAVTGEGPSRSIQYLKAADGELTGSGNFIFNQESNNLFLTGTMIISGTIQANTFDVIQTNIIEIDSSGSTSFGNNSADNHIFTGSVSIVSGGLRQHYYKLTGTTHIVQPYDSIIGVTNTSQVSITLPSASVAGVGKILIIKDETNSTRSDLNQISVSGSGGQKIDRDTTYNLSGDNPALTLYSNGVDNWFIY